MNIFLAIFGAVFWGVVAAEEEAQNQTTFVTPEYILPCQRKDPNIDKCLRKTFAHLRPYLKDGIEEIDVPSIDPLKIENLIIENGRGAFRVKASFYNITTYGASNYTINNIKTDLDNYIIEIQMHLPQIEIKGKYDVNGNVLLFPVRSKGDFWAVFLDIDGAGKIYGKELRNKDNVKFMRIDKLLVDFQLKKSRFKVRDVFNNGNVIGEAMNRFLNNNAEEIIREMKPAANVAIARHFKGFLNRAFVNLPMQVWLPDS